MKTFIMVIALASTFSQVTFAKSGRDFLTRTIPLTSVKWMGLLRCEDQETLMEHKKGKSCDLQFVEEESGEVWAVKESPTLAAIHQKGSRETQVHIEGLRSPRFLLGGSYVEIKRIETFPSEVSNNDVKIQLSPELKHVCALNDGLGTASPK